VIDQARIDANWRAITFELDAPVPSRLERVLRRAGFSSATARLVAATPALRRSWAAALVAVVLIGLGAANDDPANISAMLLLAPLVPVLGVALAYGPSVDPVHEIGLATPIRGLRLLLIRSATVVSVASAVLAGTVLLSAAPNRLAAVWLLPALALTSIALGAMTVTSPRRAVAAVSLGWGSLVFVVQSATADSLAVFGPAMQAASLITLVVAGVVVTKRHEAFDRVIP
jgi:hypothetical protein